MRRHVVRVALGAVLAALALFGLPLAGVAHTLVLDEERGELERTALAAVAQVAQGYGPGDPVELPVAEADKAVALYDPAGHLSVGDGPRLASAVLGPAFSGRTLLTRVSGRLLVAVPVYANENVIGVVTVSSPAVAVWWWTTAAWGVLLVLAGAALALAVALARRQARVLAEPLEALATTAVRVTDGDLTARSPVAGAPEVQEVARASNVMLERLTDALRHEREFSANASHQLRTPLAGLHLILENAVVAQAREPRAAGSLVADLSEAERQLRSLDDVVSGLLALPRRAAEGAVSVAGLPLPQVMRDLESRWHATLAASGRRLVVGTPDDACGTGGGPLVPAFVTAEVLSVLVENAVVHGVGRVVTTARDLGEVVALDVSDEGSLADDGTNPFARGVSGRGGTGIGLALARDLAESVDGRLVLATRHPTRFTLLVAKVPDPA